MAVALSAREGAGLYLVRRARTLAAPHQVRLLVTAFVGVLAVDLGRIRLEQARTGDPSDWAGAVAELLCYAAVALVLWRPVAGLALAALALATAAASGGTGTEPWVLLVAGAVVAAHGRRRLGWVFGAGTVGVIVLGAVLRPSDTGFVVSWFGGAALVGLVTGTALRTARAVRDGDGRQLAERATEDARLRGDERRLLARELHDVVVHQLSNASLQVMGHLDSTDPAELNRALRKVNRATDSALTELRLLARVLRHDPATAPLLDEVGELVQRVSPTAAAAAWSRQLAEAGFDPRIEIPGKADRLEMTVQATLTRALEVTGTNVLQHAPPRSWCSVTLSLSATQVVLRTANLLAPHPDEPVLGWGLRGLRERVDLTGGSFSARPTPGDGGDTEWVVVVSLPVD